MSTELKGVHLNRVEHIYLPLHFSKMQQRRARQLQSFLADLQEQSNQQLGPIQLELFVLSSRDWRSVLASPYGICVSKLRRKQGQLFAPSDYPQRLTHQFDSVFLEANFKPLGELRELLDLMLGFEWAYLNLRLRDLLTEDAELNALRVSQLYLLSLEAAGWHDLKERLKLWLSAEIVPSKASNMMFRIPKSQKAIAERYRLYATFMQKSTHTELTWHLFHT